MKSFKSFMVLMILVSVLLFTSNHSPTQAQITLDTVHVAYTLLRAEANENASVIDLTTEGDFAQKPATAIPFRTKDDGTGHGGNCLEFVFCGGSAAGKTFTYKIYAWRKTNGMARMVATGVGTLGTQAVVKYPHDGATATLKFWADTLTVTTRWMKSVYSTDTTGNNEVASLHVDFIGYEWFYVEITNADGSTEAGNVTVYYSYL